MQFLCALVVAGLVALTPHQTAGQEGTCEGRMCGDCDDNGKVTVNELLTGINNLLDPPVSETTCEGGMCGDCNDDGKVTVNELLTGINNLLDPPVSDRCDCSDCPEDDCGEFHTGVVGSVQISCKVPFCNRSEVQIAACLVKLSETTEFCTKQEVKP